MYWALEFTVLHALTHQASLCDVGTLVTPFYK